ncbi:hypothetical protein [Litoreibacter arenae]|nr:hypothetical protein [Litoreibacter arenae]
MFKHKGPLLMGGMMGLMLPWMMHMDSNIGVAFMLSHVVLVGGLAALAMFIPALRRKLVAFKGRHSHMSHLPMMGLGVIGGWAATCAYCLAIGGAHWT